MKSPSPVPEVRTTLKTQFEMDSIIYRCYEEAIETGIAKINSATSIIILDKAAFSSHLQKTLIGELLEFEIIRRISPIFREFPRLENDLNLIHRKLDEHNRLISTKVGPK